MEALTSFLAAARVVADNLLTGATNAVPQLVGEGIDAAIAVASSSFDIPPAIVAAVKAGEHEAEQIADPFIVAGLALRKARIDATIGNLPAPQTPSSTAPGGAWGGWKAPG